MQLLPWGCSCLFSHLLAAAWAVLLLLLTRPLGTLTQHRPTAPHLAPKGSKCLPCLEQLVLLQRREPTRAGQGLGVGLGNFYW